MRNIKTTCEVNIDDKENKEIIVVKSDTLFDNKITLEIGGKNYSVYAQDLKQAIDRCSNR